MRSHNRSLAVSATSMLLFAFAFLAVNVSAAVLAPMREPRHPNRVIPGRYLVRLKTPVENDHGSVLAVAAMHQEWLSGRISGTTGDSEKVLHV